MSTGHYDTNSFSRDLGLIFPCCVPGVSECGAKRGDHLGDFVCPAACSSATADVPASTNSLLFDPCEVSIGVECFLLELISGRDINIS